jgi:5'-nucleotidase
MAASEEAIDLAKVFLFDLDGSLANYDGTLLADLERMRSPAEPAVQDVRSAFGQPHLRARINAITLCPGWWAGLPPLAAGMAIFRLAKQMGFDCQVLTKGPKYQPRAWAEKVEWSQRHLGPDVDVHVVSDKGLVYGVALYDDYPRYLEAWLEHRPRGLVVMPVNASNRDFRHPNVIPYDGTNLSEVELAMRIVMERKPGEELRLLRERGST